MEFDDGVADPMYIDQSKASGSRRFHAKAPSRYPNFEISVKCYIRRWVCVLKCFLHPPQPRSDSTVAQHVLQTRSLVLSPRRRRFSAAGRCFDHGKSPVFAHSAMHGRRLLDAPDQGHARCQLALVAHDVRPHELLQWQHVGRYPLP